MGLFDYLAKKRGYVKPAPKKRSFTAAQVSRLTSSWETMPKPVDYDIKSGLRVLRARSREEVKNNDYVRGFIRTVKNNVVGHQGIALRGRVINPRGGALDKEANKGIEEAWKEWGRYGSPDVSGQHSWKSIQRMFIESIATDGEVLIRKHLIDGQLKLEFLDPELLDQDLNINNASGLSVKMGVELDGFRKPIAYYILQSSSGDYDYQVNGKQYMRIPADNIYHIYLHDFVFQTRGIPWITSALLRLNMLNGYEEAELVAARTAAAKMGFFEQDSESMGDYSTGETDENGNLISDAEAGAMEILPAGYKFTAFDPQHPTTAFSAFVKSILRGIASGLGVSYNTLANDLEGVNYSSLRQGALEERGLWMALQDWMIETFCDRVYRDWLPSALLNGIQLPTGGTLRNTDIDRYKRIGWQARRWQWVDPLKEMSAHEKGVSLGVKSRSEIIRDQGRDPEEVWEEIAQEQERLEELGIQTEPASAGFFMGEPNEEDSE